MSPRGARWYRRLLRILPFDFRADYGREMEQVFRDQHDEAAARGRSSVAGVWVANAGAILSIGPREHLAQLSQDVRYALRGMRANPGFVAVAILALALGIGANTAIFSVAHAVLLRPLPYHDPGALVSVWNKWDGRAAAALSDPEYLDYVERSRTLTIAATAGQAMVIGGDGRDAERVSGAAVTANALDVLGVSPAIGRPFAPADERPGARVVLLTHALWQSRFAGDPSVVGRTLTVDGEVHDIIGVLPDGFLLPFEFGVESRVQLLLPLPLDRAAARNIRGGHYLQAFGRLRPGVELAQARADMNGVVAALAREYPEVTNLANFGIALFPLRDDVLGDARPVLLVLAGAVGLVLLMTCANVANLLLARGEARRRELAVRTALGASRFRLVRQMLTEAWLLSAAGAAAGLVVALGCQRIVVGFAPRALPRVSEVAFNGPVLACAVALAFLAGLLFGVIPAMQISGDRRAADPLKTGTRGTEGRGAIRRALVVAQVALAVVLLVGAGLLIKSFARVMAVPSGFVSDRVLSLRISLPESRYPGRPEVTSYFERLLTAAASLPGVQSAGAASGLPLAVASGDWSFDVEGRPIVNNKHSGAADWYAVTPGFFETLGIRLVRGRGPAAGDTAASTPVLVINETTARTLFPSEDPIGKRVRFSRSRGFEQPWRTIVGIAGDVRQRGLETPPRPEVYFPHAQFQHFSPNAQARAMNVVLKTAAAPDALTASIRAEVRRLDPDVPAAQIRAMDVVTQTSTRDRRLNVLLIGAFGALALFLAVIGLYGVMAFQVAQRTREMGVRLALGASRRDVLGLVVGEAMRLVGTGLVAGVAAALLLSGSIASLLFEVTPRDLSVFASVPAVLAAAAALASYLPARRATRVDPVIALRGDA